MAADVRARLERAVAAWDLAEVRTLPGGHVSLTCAAERDARPVVVKVTPRGHDEDDDLRSEAHTLALWRATGAAVELLDRRDDDLTLLLERLQPGHTLGETGVAWEDQLEELGCMARRLHGVGAAPATFLPIARHAEYWRRALAGRPELDELDALLVPSPGDVVIHADLHPGNLLRHGAEWKTIDPKGVRGDRHADVFALVCPAAPALPADPAAAARTAARWVERYTRAAGLDAERAATWARLRARAEARVTGDRGWAARLDRLAAALG